MADVNDEIDDTTDRGRRQDPELLAMSRILRILDDVDEPARSRVVDWLHKRHTESKP